MTGAAHPASHCKSTEMQNESSADFDCEEPEHPELDPNVVLRCFNAIPADQSNFISISNQVKNVFQLTLGFDFNPIIKKDKTK